MGRQPLYTRKKNIGTIVIKWDATGAEIKTYTSINLARHEEKHSYRRLMRAINQKSPLNNFFYSLGTLYQRKPSKTLITDSMRFPWETSDGLFNIDGWAKAFV